ncbi:hypothetical protein ACFOUP_18675 [Belliella kenyensis]|uniref:Uncharacterized protein n=1 Tax=Belliella kenyensis TaxID=1472724 RepID=A0ABV8ET86_9BACT|nr:hypothetical protein [Belliella kenyensis]MCH7402198.1 hypothetical protein [Belliella kenyensis]MDN3601713.1 hypothetical protein [Belliella kenyensis]
MAWLIVLNSMVYSVICVNFQLNRSFIAEMFCENKDTIMSECNGQCYLNKQLDQASHNSEADFMEVRSDFHLFTLAEGAEHVITLIFEPLVISNDFFLQIPYQTDISKLEKPPTC